jgi:hypothetical protein
MNPSLEQAIEGVYAALRDVPRPASVDGCPCCIDRKGISVLLSKPLRDLSPEDLTHYAASVFLTVGSVEDFLYFLPRILEILAIEHDWWPDPEVVTRAIHTAGFHSWPDSRQNALRRYFEEAVGDLLGSASSGFEIDSWICALGRLHLALAPFLTRIAASRGGLLEFYEVNSQSLVDGCLANDFWDEAPDERKQVVDWFRSPATQKLIEEQYGLTS